MRRTSASSLAFIDEGVETKPPFGLHVISEITANTGNFPNLPYDLGRMTDTNTALADAIAHARTGDHEAIAAKMNAEKEWDTVFRSTGKYVSTVANGNEEIIRKGGYVPTKSETTPSQPPAMPSNFDVNPVKAAGKATVESKAKSGSGGNVFIVKSEGIEAQFVNGGIVFHLGNERVYIFPDTHPEKMLEGLQSDVKVAVSMLSFNRAGVGPATDWQKVTPQ